MAKFEPQAELPVSEQAQIRREKLEALRAEGLDPFVQTRFDFTANKVKNLFGYFSTFAHQLNFCISFYSYHYPKTFTTSLKTFSMDWLPLTITNLPCSL